MSQRLWIIQSQAAICQFPISKPFLRNQLIMPLRDFSHFAIHDLQAQIYRGANNLGPFKTDHFFPSRNFVLSLVFFLREINSSFD